MIENKNESVANLFGYVVADREKLNEEQLRRYQSCYCGLCRTIGARHGHLQRAALNYDMTFLVLLLSSLYEPEEQAQSSRCIAHPLQKKSSWSTEASAYAADMNMALAYHNCMDDWHDDKKLKALLLAMLFRSSALRVKEQYPVQWQAICACMDTLKEIEANNLQDPDAGANAFGGLMGALFLWKEDRWSPLLIQMGQSLGRFIYLLDAVQDAESDQKGGSYNPLLSRFRDGRKKEDFLPVLKLMIGECTDAFERLPLIQDVDLMRNILYSGVWCRFFQKENGSGKEAQQHV